MSKVHKNCHSVFQVLVAWLVGFVMAGCIVGLIGFRQYPESALLGLPLFICSLVTLIVTGAYIAGHWNVEDE